MAETDQRDFDSPYGEAVGVKKPSQAEGEREAPGEADNDKENFDEPLKPSQAEGERKPYQ